MWNVIFANIVQLFSNAFEFASNGIKKRRTTIQLQFFARICDGITDFLLMGYSGLVVDIVATVRNYLNLKDRLTPQRQLFLVVATMVLIPLVNNRGTIGLLPLVSVVFFTCSSRIKDPFAFKMLNAVDFLPWIVYDFTIQSYVSMIGDIISVVLCCFAAVRIKRREDRAEKRRLRARELAREARRIKKERAQRRARLERISAKLSHARQAQQKHKPAGRSVSARGKTLWGGTGKAQSGKTVAKKSQRTSRAKVAFATHRKTVTKHARA